MRGNNDPGRVDMTEKWVPPEDWILITTIDVHTAGEPLRVVTGGFPELSGDTMLERRRHLKENLDHLRRALMWEPRGHRGMYGCIVTSPVESDSDIGILFMHNEGYSTMCGHGIIGIATVAPEIGLVPIVVPETEIRIDTPAGQVTACARVEEGGVKSVRFQNVPSFVDALDETVEVPDLGEVRYDLAFGGAYYAYVMAEDVGLTCTPEEQGTLIERGMAIKNAIIEKRPIVHPFEEDLGFLYGTIFIGPPRTGMASSRNVCIFADGQVDRSPTGTGVSGRAAIHHYRGELGVDEPLIIESIVDTLFTVTVVETTTYGDFQAVIPSVEGSAHITGVHEFMIDPADPLKEGFLLG